MTQREFKKRYDPDLDKYVNKHIFDGSIYGEGMTDVFKVVGNKLLRKIAESTAKKGATTTGKYAGNKGGYKIFELLNKKKTKTPSEPTEPKKLTTEEINNTVNQILSGGKLRRRKII